MTRDTAGGLGKSTGLWQPRLAGPYGIFSQNYLVFQFLCKQQDWITDSA